MKSIERLAAQSLLALLALTCVEGGNCAATTVAGFTNLSGGTIAGASRFGGLLGVSFDPTAPVEITALGFLDLNFFTFQPDGFSTPIIVGLYNLSTQTELGRVILPAGTGSPLVNNFRYEDLASPITVTPGATYELVALMPPPSDLLTTEGEVNAATFTADPRLSNVQFYAENSNPGLPLTDINPLFGALPISIFGPNMLVTPVPEPGTALLLLFGLTALLARGLVRRSRAGNVTG